MVWLRKLFFFFLLAIASKQSKCRLLFLVFHCHPSQRCMVMKDVVTIPWEHFSLDITFNTCTTCWQWNIPQNKQKCPHFAQMSKPTVFTMTDKCKHTLTCRHMRASLSLSWASSALWRSISPSRCLSSSLSSRPVEGPLGSRCNDDNIEKITVAKKNTQNQLRLLLNQMKMGCGKS